MSEGHKTMVVVVSSGPCNHLGHVTSFCVYVFSSRLNDYKPSKKRWDLSRLPRFSKDFYKEHPNVAALSDVSRFMSLQLGDIILLWLPNHFLIHNCVRWLSFSTRNDYTLGKLHTLHNWFRLTLNNFGSLRMSLSKVTRFPGQWPPLTSLVFHPTSTPHWWSKDL